MTRAFHRQPPRLCAAPAGHGPARSLGPHALCPAAPVPFLAEARRSHANASDGQGPPRTAGKPSAHLTLRPQSLAQNGESGSPTASPGRGRGKELAHGQGLGWDGAFGGRRGDVSPVQSKTTFSIPPRQWERVGARPHPPFLLALSTSLPPADPPSSPGNSRRFGNLSQSCRHAISRWEDSTIHSHLQNITYRDGRLRVNQAGKYYVYSQIYFRYPSDGASARASVPQLVQCINWKTSYSQPILLLKGVGTKCWAPEADYGLHALYQGGLFELKAGDELFVSVSSLAIDYNDAAASYFGAFRLDL